MYVWFCERHSILPVGIFVVPGRELTRIDESIVFLDIRFVGMLFQ